MSSINIEEMQSETEEENSACIRSRVMAAMEIQNRRYEGVRYRYNADIMPQDILKYCVMEDKASETLKRIYNKLGLSVRAYHKLLKVSRTIADLEQSDIILDKHVKEAACYRFSM